MKIEDAREIVSHPENYCDSSMLHQMFDNAKGFLEGYEQGVREAVKIVNKQCPNHFPLVCTDSQNIHGMAREILKLLDEANGEGK